MIPISSNDKDSEGSYYEATATTGKAAAAAATDSANCTSSDTSNAKKDAVVAPFRNNNNGMDHLVPVESSSTNRNNSRLHQQEDEEEQQYQVSETPHMWTLGRCRDEYGTNTTDAGNRSRRGTRASTAAVPVANGGGYSMGKKKQSSLEPQSPPRPLSHDTDCYEAWDSVAGSTEGRTAAAAASSSVQRDTATRNANHSFVPSMEPPAHLAWMSRLLWPVRQHPSGNEDGLMEQQTTSTRRNANSPRRSTQAPSKHTNNKTWHPLYGMIQLDSTNNKSDSGEEKSTFASTGNGYTELCGMDDRSHSDPRRLQKQQQQPQVGGLVRREGGDEKKTADSYYSVAAAATDASVASRNTRHRLSILSDAPPNHSDDYAFFFHESDQRPISTAAASSTSPVAIVRRNHRHAALYEYNDAVPVMARPALQRFRHLYAQLNQENSSIQNTSRWSQDNANNERRSRGTDHSLSQPTTTTTRLSALTNQCMGLLFPDYPNDANTTMPLEADPWDDMAVLRSLHLQMESSTLALSSSLSDQLRADDDNDDYARVQPPSTPDWYTTPHHQSGSSSLCYEANGQLLMRLPRDQVRLLMDPDLPPGILSVEQWRIVRHDKQQDGAVFDDSSDYYYHNHRNKGNMSSSSPPPSLRYVLTVSDDLYKSLVAEMSPTTIQFFCCPRACCNEEERADIRVAVCLLLIILGILLINTLAFHEH